MEDESPPSDGQLVKTYIIFWGRVKKVGNTQISVVVCNSKEDTTFTSICGVTLSQYRVTVFLYSFRYVGDTSLFTAIVLGCPVFSVSNPFSPFPNVSPGRATRYTTRSKWTSFPHLPRSCKVRFDAFITFLGPHRPLGVLSLTRVAGSLFFGTRSIFVTFV